MFTGIITDVGHIAQLEQRGDLRARISTRYDMSSVDMGASIACDGVCLTVVGKGLAEGDQFGWFDVDVSAETVSKTNLDTWSAGRRINLERALKVTWTAWPRLSRCMMRAIALGSRLKRHRYLQSSSRPKARLRLMARL